MIVFRNIVYTIVLIICFSGYINAQSFGFGCLGLVNGYAGYSYQVYKPTGLNNYIDFFNTIREDSLDAPLKHFGKGTGFRVGVNFFRANVEGFVLTAKGFYQLSNERTGATVTTSSGITNTNFQLKIKTFGVGFDLGIDVTKSLSWKVLDAAFLFNNAEYNATTNHPFGHTDVLRYNTEKGVVGYSLGTGFILELIDQYVSLEGLAGYTFFSLDKIIDDENTYLTVNESSTEVMNNFIESGGFIAVIQLNIGFPL